MKINKRLQAIAKYVNDNSSVIDVGCDHALLSIYLVSSKKNINCIASDLKQGPLNQAVKNISKYCLNDKIKIKLGYGIETIEKGTDTIVISGMGGSTIVDILYKDVKKLNNVRQIILSPNNDFYKVRKKVSQIGFKITKEEIIKDNNKFYPIIVFERGKRKLTKEELFCGCNVLSNNDYKEYILLLISELNRKLKNMPKKYIFKRLKIKKEISILFKRK